MTTTYVVVTAAAFAQLYEQMPGPRVDIRALYECQREPLLVYFVRRTVDTEVALDLWAETFAQAAAGARRHRGASQEEAAAWLFGIARRQLALYYRRGYAERRALDRLGLERPRVDEAVEAEIAERAGLDAVRREIAQALATLSKEVRETLVLRVVEDLSYPQVAAQLAISEPAARARVSRGLRALGELLDSTAMMEAIRR